MSGAVRPPWWKRRWRRVPFWAWAGSVIVVVGVIGSLAEGDGSGAGTGVADLDRMTAPTTPAASSAPTTSPPSTDAATSSLAPSSTSTLPHAQPATTVVNTTLPPATTVTTAPPPPVVIVPVPVVPAPDVAAWTVTSVTDGDTIDVVGREGSLTVRLIGINTPESGECWADEAAAALSALIGGEGVELVRDTSDTDQYGRALRYVETVDGVDVGAALVEAGHAIARRYPPDTARADRYDELQRQASDAGRGQWAPDACGAPVVDVAITVEIRYDAAGDDNFNLNDEWVRFTNAGAAPVDLDGWIVADESASHRYHFADLVLAPGGSVTLFTGCGGDTADARYWCNTGSAVWNNDGDTVFLRDPAGNNVVVHEY